jgi:hypothetical protein
VVQSVAALEVNGGVPQTEFFVDDTTGFLIDLNGLDLTTGNVLVMRVFVDGFEDSTLREAIPVAEVGETVYMGLGEASNFVLLSGVYTVDLYLDNLLVGQARFDIVEAFGGGDIMAEDATSGTVDVSFEAVEGWSAFVEEDGVFFADADDVDAVGIVLIEPGVQADELLDVFDMAWGGDLVGEAESYSFDGVDGLRFAYTFEDGGDVFTGEAVGMIVGTDAVYVMAEVFDGESVAGPLLDAVLGGVSFSE